MPSARQKGWLGVSSDPLELPLALSLGLRNANGALIVETTAGGPAGMAGVRFGDIIVGFNGSAIDSIDALRQRVSATMPGTEVVLEVWRITNDDGDFLRTLRRLGESGNAAVMYRLGRMYAGGIGVARDDNEAIRWFRMGAAAGNLNATTMYAIGLIEGRGTGKDPQEGVRLLKSAADRNNPDAMHRLAVMLVNGKVVDKDIPEAVHLMTKAGEAGHAPAMVDLAVMYNQGIGMQANPAKAAHWSKRGAISATRPPWSTSAICTSTARASKRAIPRPSPCTGEPPTWATPWATTIWRRCSTEAKAWSAGTPSKPPSSCCGRWNCATSSPIN